ncbi:unnamed protein product [Lactuca virosa]|uniref:Uncharacterized protein n=1 Tax=Lactuca virosa TaxID=75947 RepID=A0AAU9LWM9_9ASTR|nr:unnamed protein product [Lactuca virosa]
MRDDFILYPIERHRYRLWWWGFFVFLSGGPTVYILHRHHHFPFMSFVSGRYIFYMSVEKNCCIEAVNMLKGSAHVVFVEMPKRRFLNLLQSWNWGLIWMIEAPRTNKVYQILTNLMGKVNKNPTDIQVGVAARALHLSRGVEKPSGRVTYIVVLQGLSRFGVEELNTIGTYTTARISPIDMTKAAETGCKKPDIMLCGLGRCRENIIANAAALGRKFIRISLGGVKDDADIKAHGRTYIGSMSGRLIDGLKLEIRKKKKQTQRQSRS